jgi:chromatin remodeling complex protein RSC6
LAKKKAAKAGKKSAKKSAKKTAKKAPAKKAAKKSAKKSGGGRRGGGAAFMKPMNPDPALSAVVGAGPKPRTEIVKKLWAYIRNRGLQDKTNKRMINADDALSKVFGGKKQVSMFEMTKLVNQHLSG